MINKNGFTTPLHPYQIISWIIFFWHTIIPPILISPFLDLQEMIIFLIIFYITHILVINFGYKATKSNPSVAISYDPI